jgi:hypothetical protein
VRYALWMGPDGTLVQLVPKLPQRRSSILFRNETELPERPLRAILLVGICFTLLLLTSLLTRLVPEGAIGQPAVALLTLILGVPVLFMPVVAACLMERWLDGPERRRAGRFHKLLWDSRVRYEGGDGSRPEQAVIVRGALHPLIAKAGALWVLMGACQQQGLKWEMVGFDRLTLDHRTIDRFVIRLSSGVERAFYFDITESLAEG